MFAFARGAAAVITVAALCFWPRVVRAQATATLTGVVRDQTGAPLATARVSGREGAASSTDADGRFRLTLPAGRPGSITVAAVGFQPEQIAIAAIAAGRVRELAITLRPLAVLDALTVTASRARPLLNTEDAATGGALEAAELVALPTDARDPLALLFNVPGVTQAQAFFGDAPPLSFNGQNALYSQYLLDGLDNNEGYLGGPRVEMPLSALARIDALVNTYSTEFGRSPSGAVNMLTKAGGNDTHGDLFAFWRPGRPFDARNPVPYGGVPEAIARQQDGFRRLQLGGSLSGALRRDRTFYSTAVEYTNENEDRIGSTALAPFLGTEKREKVKLFGRLDQGWSPTQTTTFRVAASFVNRAGQGSGIITPEADITTRRVGVLAAATHRSALGEGTASNTASVQLGTFSWNFPPTTSDFSRPQVTVVTPQNATQAVVGSSNFVFNESELSLQLRDVFQAELGHGHELRAGADMIAASFTLQAASTNPLGSYVVVNNGNISAPAGRPLTFTDIPANVQVQSYTIDARPQQVDLTQFVAGAFVEDRWRVSPSLLIIGGVRWDYDDLTSRGASSPDLNNIQPRVSFNWYRTPTHVIRGGFGLYSGKFPYAIYSDGVQLGPNGNAVVSFAGSSAPAFLQGKTPAQLQAQAGSLPPREVFQLFARGLQQPLSYQATLGTQVQLGRDWAISLDAVYVDTRNLPRLLDLNAINRPLTPADSVNLPCTSVSSCPGDAFRPQNPLVTGYRRLSTADAGGRSLYRAIYLAIRRRLGDAWTVDANYTLSHAQNDTEDINFSAVQGNCFSEQKVDAVTGRPCSTTEWADASNDRRHHVTVRTVYTVNSRLRLSLITDVQSGIPANRVAGFASTSGNATYDLLGSGSIRGNSFIGNSDRFFGVERNAERLTGYTNVRVGAAYLLPVRKDVVELRADLFNLFNATDFAGFATGTGASGSQRQFGRPGDPINLYTAGPPRQMQFSARWAF